MKGVNHDKIHPHDGYRPGYHCVRERQDRAV